MKRTRAQNPKLQDPQDPAAAVANPKPQRKAKQPKAAGAGGKNASAAAAAREAAAAAAAAADSASAVSSVVEMAPIVPDVGAAVEVAGGLPADWDEMDGAGNGSPWWTFGVEEEKLLGWFPFVEEDFSGCHAHGGAGGRGDVVVEPEPAGFDDDIWRIHQIYEIPSYADKRRWRTRAQNPKLQDPQDPAAAVANPKPQRKAKQPRQPKAAVAGGKKASAAAAAREAAAAAAAAADSASAASSAAEMAPIVPDVGAAVEVVGGLPADWDEMDGAGNGSPWWTFGVEEEKLLGWFPFVEEDFGGCHGGNRIGGAEPEPAGFDDDIWRIHQIYEIPSYAAK